MPEYALAEFWIYSSFYVCHDAEYGRALNIQELHRTQNMWQSDNKQGSESVSYNAQQNGALKVNEYLLSDWRIQNPVKDYFHKTLYLKSL